MQNFDYIDPSAESDAVGFLKDGAWDATSVRAIAGGQDLLGELKSGLLHPTALVNLKALPEEATRTMQVAAGGNVRLGSLVSLAQLVDMPANDPVASLLQAAASTIASPQIRSHATLGGNLCQRPRCLYYRRAETVCLKKGGDECFSYGGNNKYNAILGGGPSFIVHPSDMAPALIALDARITLQTPEGRTEMALEDFFTLPSDSDVTRENILRPGDVLTSIETHLSAAHEWRTTYVKFQERDGFDFALSAVALALAFDGDTVADARLVLGGVAPKPWRVPRAEAALKGVTRGDRAGFEALCKTVGEAALRGAEPLDQNAYKVPLTKGLIQKALHQLLLS